MLHVRCVNLMYSYLPFKKLVGWYDDLSRNIGSTSIFYFLYPLIAAMNWHLTSCHILCSLVIPTRS